MSERAGRRPLRAERGVDIGPYRGAIPIAVGGMAEVFRALRPQPAGDDRAVVIKRLLPELVEDPQQRAMFEHEAELGRRIRHPNVVEVLDHAVGAQPYLVLEYVFGVDLRHLVRFVSREGNRLPHALAAFVATELLAGLSAVHGATSAEGQPLSIVHRDVSPSNVFLSVHGDVKLGDLGIARPFGRDARRDGGAMLTGGTQAERAKGKLLYLAPEQVEGAAVDARADIFAAAAVTAELFLGRPLFSAETELGVLLSIRDVDLQPLEAARGSLPPGLVDALMRALARDPARRTGDAATLRQAILPFLDGPAVDQQSALGALVVRALDAGEPAKDRTSLAHTIEADLRVGRPTSTMPPRASGAAAPRDSRTSSPDVPQTLYAVRSQDRELGPWPYARLVQALRSGEVPATALVAADGLPMRPVALVPELARHLLSSARTPSGPTPGAPVQVGDAHDLGAGGLLRILSLAWRNRATGLVLCERGAVRKEIHLERGVPTFITSNQVEELLGEQLVRAGVVERSELELALTVMPRFGGRLGDSLVALGLVEPVALFRHIAGQVREKLFEIFTWPDGRAALYRAMEAPERSFPIDLDPFALLEAGVRRRIEQGLEPRSEPGPKLVGPTVDTELTLLLPPHAQRVVDAVRTPRSLGELERADADPARTRATVLVLRAIGAVRFV